VGQHGVPPYPRRMPVGGAPSPEKRSNQTTIKVSRAISKGISLVPSATNVQGQVARKKQGGIKKKEEQTRERVRKQINRPETKVSKRWTRGERTSKNTRELKHREPFSLEEGVIGKNRQKLGGQKQFAHRRRTRRREKEKGTAHIPLASWKRRVYCPRSRPGPFLRRRVDKKGTGKGGEETGVLYEFFLEGTHPHNRSARERVEGQAEQKGEAGPGNFGL